MRASKDLADAVGRDLDDGDVERTAAQVVDDDLALAGVARAVRERRGSRLVDDADDVEARDLARVARRLALVVVEVRGDGDDRLPHWLLEVVFCGRPELLQ